MGDNNFQRGLGPLGQGNDLGHHRLVVIDAGQCFSCAGLRAFCWSVKIFEICRF